MGQDKNSYSETHKVNVTIAIGCDKLIFIVIARRCCTAANSASTRTIYTTRESASSIKMGVKRIPFDLYSTLTFIIVYLTNYYIGNL